MRRQKPRLTILLMCCGIISLGFATFQFYHFSVFVVDDAYISYRYAENFAGGDGLVFNKGEYVEGYTNFLWVIFLGLLKKIGIDVRLSSLGLGTFFSILTLFLTMLVSHNISAKHSTFYEHEWLCVIFKMTAVLYIATSPAFGIWSVAGLETPLVMCLLISAVWLRLREEVRTGGFPFSALGFGLLTLTRPEGIMYFGLTLFYSIIYRFRYQKHQLLEFWKPVSVFLCIVLPHVLWRWQYYGSLLPNTYYMKVGGRFYFSGIKYVYEFFLSYGGISFFCICSICLIAYRFQEYWVGYFLLLLGVSILYFIYVGGDWMPAFRFFVPLLPLFFLCVQEGIRELFLHFPKRTFWRPGFGAVILSLVVLVNNAYVFYTTPRIDSRFDGHIEIGKFLKTHASPNDVLAAIDIGALAYFSGLRTIDYFGLADSHIARLAPKTYTFEDGFWNHHIFTLKSDTDYVLSQKPRFVELNTSNAPKTLEQTIPADPYSELMLRNPGFREAYAPFYYAGGTTIFIKEKAF